MTVQGIERYTIQIEEGDYRGDLYELERVTTFRLINSYDGQVILELQGEMSASLDRESGLWSDPVFSGVAEMAITEDGTHVRVHYHDGQEEILQIP
jgi:hypothetical protein